MSDYHARAKELVSQMTLEEKAALVSGADFSRTKAEERLNIPAIRMTDGPHGLRLPKSDRIADIANNIPATCFPTASAVASSWNPELAERVGAAIGAECQTNNVQVLLGPGVCMKRSPLGGRNFEYYAEDPVLGGKLAAAHITGVQSQGVGTSLKHFAANEQEYDRMTNSSEVDERTLHEVSLQGFEIAVREAKPWSVMVSYNKLNGTYTTESSYLLRDVLRKRWNYGGVAVSDWSAVDNRVASLRAGLQLEMPGPAEASTEAIVQAAQDGLLDQAVLDEAIVGLLAYILGINDQRQPDASYDADTHHGLAREAASESIVLLKNDDNLLPLMPETYKTVAIIGRIAKEPRYQGGGSSQIAPTKTTNAFDALQTQLGEQITFMYASGYDDADETNDQLLEEAAAIAAQADVAMVFAGLPAHAESEGFDRPSIDLPDGHNRLVAAVADANPACGVVLSNGAAVAMPWADKVRGIVEAWLSGQASGEAIADILSGRVNPSGKLSETFPRRIEDTPAFPDFPSRDSKAIYGEGVFTGYRHYDMHKIEPLFPFGFGLSYTSFAYEQIQASKTSLTDQEIVEITVTVKNTGNRAGKETVQLYVSPGSDADLTVRRPVKTLRAFQKVQLEPGEQTTLTFTLGFRDFAFYDTVIHDWRVPKDDFGIQVGGSSVDLPLQTRLYVAPAKPFVPPVTRETPLHILAKHPVGKTYYDQFAAQMPPDLLPIVQGVPISRLQPLFPQFTPETVDAIVEACNSGRS